MPAKRYIVSLTNDERQTLEQLTLKTIGISDEQSIPTMKTSLSKHLIRAYQLPTEKARSDTTSFSVYHQPSEMGEDSSIIRIRLQ